MSFSFFEISEILKPAEKSLTYLPLQSKYVKFLLKNDLLLIKLYSQVKHLFDPSVIFTSFTNNVAVPP